MAEDLSRFYGPVGDLFAPSGETPDRQKVALTEEQIVAYERRGYLAPVRVLDDPQIEALRDELAELMTPGHAGCELWYEYHVPGSQRWPLLPRGVLAGDMDAVSHALTDQQRAAFQPAPCELKAGEASFHHPRMLHGSHANRSDRPRRAIVLNFFADGVRSDQDEPLLEGTDPIPRGDPMAGRFPPLLASTDDLEI